MLAIFPEGTRSHSKELLPFKGGAKIIADKLNLKIQPVVIMGSDIMDVKKFSFKNGKIKNYLPRSHRHRQARVAGKRKGENARNA